MRLLTIMLAALALLAGSYSAFAHALLRHTQPPVGSTVKAAPAELVLMFPRKSSPLSAASS